MHDPHFEAIVAEIRGFDLGDDPQLLDHLDAQMADGLRGDEWLLRGVLLYRAGRVDEAVDCLDHAADQGHARSVALYLRSCVQREHGSLGEALESLDEAREAAREDELLSPAEFHHAEGLLHWRVNNREDALARIDEALALDEGAASRWLHRGQLLVELGRVDEARRALDRALLEEQDLDRAMFERAALEASRSDGSAAAEWLHKATRLEPGYRREADSDPRFESVRAHPAMAEILDVAEPGQLEWLDELVDWLAPLRRDDALERLGVEWLSEARSERIAEALAADYERGPMGTMHTEATLGRSRDLLSTRRAVAQGPAVSTREGVREGSLLFVDVSRPDDGGLWLALSESYPPFLWIPIDPTPASVERTLREFFPRPHLTRVDMPRQVRGFLGYRGGFVVPSHYAGGVEPATVAALDRHFTLNPFVESASWGSAFPDDPWPDDIPDQPELTLKIAQQQQRVSEQAAGHVWSLSRRTRHSRSYLTLEVHHHDLFVVQLRYRPSSFPSVIEQMNAHFGCDYPLDLPVDAVAALLGFQFDGAADLEAQLPDLDAPEPRAGLLLVLSALRHGDVGVLELYRRHLRHPDLVVRSTVVDIAVASNHEVLLEEMSQDEPDPGLRAEIESLLDHGIPMLEEDPYRADATDPDDDDVDELEVELVPDELEEIPEVETVELELADGELESEGEVSGRSEAW